MKKVLLLLSVLLLNSSFQAGDSSFQSAEPGYEFEFPRDHGSHEAFRTEWWYYTGHLTTEAGKRFGFELTFFRVGVAPPRVPAESRWDLRNLALAHFALTDIDGRRFRYHEKLNRAAPFTAAAATGFLDVFNEGWKATTTPDGSWRLIAADRGDAIDLTMSSRKAPAVHGENGVSIKAPAAGYASHYYSMTRLEVTGKVTAGGKTEPCTGLAWMDHEFGSSALRENQQGWDWFSVQLDNDTELMLYQIRRADGTPDVTSSGSLITSDGHVIHLRHDQMRIATTRRWRSRRSRATYPMGWKISIPSLRLSLSLESLLDDQELVTRASTQVTYWEGAVRATGSLENNAVSGKGYVEMTGYDRAFRAP